MPHWKKRVKAQKQKFVGLWMDPEIQAIGKKEADRRDISFSAYVRGLITEDEKRRKK